jgi:hypothetical protein
VRAMKSQRPRVLRTTRSSASGSSMARVVSETSTVTDRRTTELCYRLGATGPFGR